MKTTKIIPVVALMATAGISIAGCTVESAPIQAAATAPAAATQPAPAEQLLADGVWNSDRGAVLTVRDGRPVAYTFGNYRAQSLSLRGSIVTIDQGRLTISEAGSDTFSGTFALGGQVYPVTFARQS